MIERDPRWENVYAEIFDANRDRRPGEPKMWVDGLKIVRIALVIEEKKLYIQYAFDPIAVNQSFNPQVVFGMMMDNLVYKLDKDLDKEGYTK